MDVYFRTASGWEHQATIPNLLTGPNLAPGDEFGKSVDIDGNTLAVGSNMEPDGSVHIYTRFGGVWSHVDSFHGGDDDPNEGYANAIAVDGPLLAVGVPGADGVNNAFDVGQVVLFRRQSFVSWAADDLLFSPSPEIDGRFGSDVAVSGDTVAVSAADERASDDGNVHIFVDGDLEQTIAGISGRVEIDGDTLMIAADDAVYVYTRTLKTWRFLQTLPRGGVSPIDLDGDTAVVGLENSVLNPRDDVPVAWLFRRVGPRWWFHGSLFSDELTATRISVSVSGNSALVGEPENDGPAGTIQGSAIFFDIPVECLPPLIVNTTTVTQYDALEDAASDADVNDEITATGPAFAEPTPAASPYPVHLSAVGSIRQPLGATLSLASGSTFFTDVDSSTEWHGELALSALTHMSIAGPRFLTGAGSRLTLGPNALLDASAAGTTALNGPTDLLPGASLLAGQRLTNSSAFTVLGGVVSCDAQFVNAGDVVVQNDTTLIADYVNQGDTSVQNGSLIIAGAVAAAGGVAGTDGDLFVEHDYRAGPASALLLPGGTAKFGADVDIAINDNLNFDMATAELRMVGLPGSEQTLEVMSRDIGELNSGLDRTLLGHFPIETLRIGPTHTVVRLVDKRDNDGLGQDSCEAVYARTVVIEPGAELITAGCKVYYETLTVLGAVDDSTMLTELGRPCETDTECNDNQICTADLCTDGSCTFAPAVYGDANLDDKVDVADIFCVLDGFRGVFANCLQARVDMGGCASDGEINMLDIQAVLDAFAGTSPCCVGPPPHP